MQETIVSVFVQDEYQPREGLSVNLGARWDHTQWPGPSSRRDDVAPRLGVAIDPWKKGTTVFRAGAGRYYDESGLEIARARRDGIHHAVDRQTRAFRATRCTSIRTDSIPTGAVRRWRSTASIDTRRTPRRTPTRRASACRGRSAREIGVAVDLVRARGHQLPVGPRLELSGSRHAASGRVRIGV